MADSDSISFSLNWCKTVIVEAVGYPAKILAAGLAGAVLIFAALAGGGLGGGDDE